MRKKQQLHFDFLSDTESPQMSARSTKQSPRDQLCQTLSADRLLPKAKRGLLSPIPRKTVRKTTHSRKQIKLGSSRSHPSSTPSLRKGFQLLRTLFTTALQASTAPIPLPEAPAKRQTVVVKDPPARIVLPEVEIKYKVNVREPSSRSASPASPLSHFLEFESGVQTPRRKSSTKEITAPTFPDIELTTEKPIISSEPKLIPVMRIQQIEPDELADSSDDEKDVPSVPVSRRSSRFGKETAFMRRGTMTTLEEPTPLQRRYSVRADIVLPRSDTKRELMADYQLKTAEMLSDTQFRVKGFKQQRAIPQRYFKNL